MHTPVADEWVRYASEANFSIFVYSLDDLARASPDYAKRVSRAVTVRKDRPHDMFRALFVVPRLHYLLTREPSNATYFLLPWLCDGWRSRKQFDTLRQGLWFRGARHLFWDTCDSSSPLYREVRSGETRIIGSIKTNWWSRGFDASIDVV